MRFLIATTLGLALAAPLAGQAPKKPAKAADRDLPTKSAGNLPSGWLARTDQIGDEAAIKFVAGDSGYHVTPGPPAVLWRAADRMEGPFQAVATFTQTRAPQRLEGYGLFVGGGDLNGDGQKYTYFLVRGDGKYLIKRRDGAATLDITSGWTAHPAIQRANSAGRATNRLEVTMGRDRTTFSVNGKQVYLADPRLIDGKGLAGLRVNQYLDVEVDGFAVHKLP